MRSFKSFLELKEHMDKLTENNEENHFEIGKKHGKQAFIDGKKSVPALDTNARDYMHKLKGEDSFKKYNKYLDGWAKGWHGENLK